MASPLFFKFAQGSASHLVIGAKFNEGLNTDDTWVAEHGVAGGFHVTTLDHAIQWSMGATHVYDVEIPAGVHVTLGKDKAKAQSVILSRHRHVRDLLAPYPIDVQARIFINYPELMKQLGVLYTPEMAKVHAPKLMHTVDGIEFYDNGLRVTRVDGGYVGVFTRDTKYISTQPAAGTSFRCQDFRDGHAYGPGSWIKSSGDLCTGTFLHTYFDGPGTYHGNPCKYSMGVPDVTSATFANESDPAIVQPRRRRTRAYNAMPVQAAGVAVIIATKSDDASESAPEVVA
jgi:hypothetical protein